MLALQRDTLLGVIAALRSNIELTIKLKLFLTLLIISTNTSESPLNIISLIFSNPFSEAQLQTMAKVGEYSQLRF